MVLLVFKRKGNVNSVKLKSAQYEKSTGTDFSSMKKINRQNTADLMESSKNLNK